MMVVFKIRDSVPSPRYSPFVMYCVNGKPRSSLLIESTDSMITYVSKLAFHVHNTFTLMLCYVNLLQYA